MALNETRAKFTWRSNVKTAGRRVDHDSFHWGRFQQQASRSRGARAQWAHPRPRGCAQARAIHMPLLGYGFQTSI